MRKKASQRCPGSYGRGTRRIQRETPRSETSNDRRRILHFNVTRHPTSLWIVQQLREAFPYGPTTKFLLLDHDAKYGIEVPNAIRSMNINPVRTAVGCPWQNGVAERWVGSCRRELLDQVIAINESHLKRLLSSYIDYYHQDRTQVVSGSKLLKIENTAPAEAR